MIATVVAPLDSVEDHLRANAERVWREMKASVVARISGLYEKGDKDDVSELRRALIHNATLALTPPRSAVAAM